ncbi:WD40-repeat-containing domain protein [Blyttiomyces helicus]|uniref:WD40-repeat-containing domain protein n=1 Tax=Blyttiomyces helicus TaxID=388810 RepID=A0A4V1IQP5_9FUNG|nr:WD40-repeat-containing domain protein [Blyttiomyces helicus]|eukprot:RKO87277.1 WD40-repeat-containing domain protein [Blyttiomyces helicus]
MHFYPSSHVYISPPPPLRARTPRPDPLSRLCPELCLHILSFLHPVDLDNSAQVSRSWNAAARDPALWFAICAKEGYCDPSVVRLATAPPFVFDQAVVALPDSPEMRRSAWRRLYIERQRIFRNRLIGRNMCVNLSGHEDLILSVSVCGNTVASGSRNGDVFIQDGVGTGLTVHKDSVKRQLSFLAHITGVSCLEMNEVELLTGSWDNTVKVWDRRQLMEDIEADIDEPVSKVTLTHPKSIICIKRRGDYLVSGTLGGTVHFWDLREPKKAVRAITFAEDKLVSSVDFDDEFIFATNSQGKLCSWSRSDPSDSPVWTCDAHEVSTFAACTPAGVDVRCA